MSAIIDNQETTRDTAQEIESLTGLLTHMLGQIRQSFHEALTLVVMEGRLAGLSLALMLGLSIAAGIMAISSWLLLFAAMASWLVIQGMSLSLALLIMAIINLLLAVIAGFIIHILSRNLLFPVSRRSLLKSEKPCSKDD